MSGDGDAPNPLDLGYVPGTAEPERDAAYPYTHDLGDDFFSGLVRVCDEVQCAPRDLLAVMMNESAITPWAHNANGDAVGLIQFMPPILRGLGFLGGWQAFAKLSAAEQLPFVARYLRPHTGKLVNATALYLAVFLPALIDHASDPTYELVVKDGKLGWAYAPNIGFDRDRDGVIRVDELTYAINRAVLAPRYVEACARAGAATTALPPSAA